MIVDSDYDQPTNCVWNQNRFKKRMLTNDDSNSKPCKMARVQERRCFDMSEGSQDDFSGATYGTSSTRPNLESPDSSQSDYSFGSYKLVIDQLDPFINEPNHYDPQGPFESENILKIDQSQERQKNDYSFHENTSDKNSCDVEGDSYDRNLLSSDSRVISDDGSLLDIFGIGYFNDQANARKQNVVQDINRADQLYNQNPNIPYQTRSDRDENNYLDAFQYRAPDNSKKDTFPPYLGLDFSFHDNNREEFDFSFHDSDREEGEITSESNKENTDPELLDPILTNDSICDGQEKANKRGQSVYDYDEESSNRVIQEINAPYNAYNPYNVPLVSFPKCEGTPKQIKNINEPKLGNFISPEAGWKRVFQKYSPSTETLHSPVKPIEANLQPTVTIDSQLYGLVWILSMSEQFYYDNSIILLQNYVDDITSLKEVLRINYESIDAATIADTMVDVNILGSGTFGDVYRARKEFSDEYYAIKFLKNAPKNEFYEHTNSLLDYLKEKNHLIKARKSPFVVQFLYSVKFPNVNGLFLFFEWCICDLRKYLNLVSFTGSVHTITSNLWDNIEDGIDEVLLDVYSHLEDDLYPVTLVYIFEVFCAIDFLAKCNIVHQDLKPENIMIATNLHLKIGDFGLAYNTKFITRPSQMHLVEAISINRFESSNYKAVYGGTTIYEDMEQCFRSLIYKNTPAARKILESRNRLDYPLPTDSSDANPEFLSDLWSCGIIATELIFGGVHFLYPSNFSLLVRSEMKISDNFLQAVLEITYMKYNYHRYIEKGLLAYGGESLTELMNFLASIFKPRPERAIEYTEEKEIYRYKRKVKLKHIDIRKVEKISMFQSMGINSNNTFLYNFPSNLSKKLTKSLRPGYRTLRHLLMDQIERDEENFFNLEPGIKSSYL